MRAEGWRKVGAFNRDRRSPLDIEVAQIKTVGSRCEVLARAWWRGEQIGFGPDGSVDVERFIFGRTPVLVPAKNGDIARAYDDGERRWQQRYRHDPKAALLATLRHTIGVKKQRFGARHIERDKVGSTTLTEYPQAGTGTAPIDGAVGRIGVSESATDIWANAGLFNDGATATITQIHLVASTTTDEFESTRRYLAGFDTSAIGSGGTISSATLSLYMSTAVTTLGDTSIVVVDANPASESAIANDDYGNFGSTIFGTVVSSLSGAASNQYHDATLNASGIANINKTGNTFFGAVLGWDQANSFGGTWSSGDRTRGNFYLADQADTPTLADPKLVVEYTAGASAVPVFAHHYRQMH